MPAKQSNTVAGAQRKKKAKPASFVTLLDWELARPDELRRFDEIPKDAATTLTNLVSFGNSTADLDLASDWETLISDTVFCRSGRRQNWEPRVFTYPRVYRFFLHYLQAAGKFYVEVGHHAEIPLTVDIRALGVHFLWLANGFVEEAIAQVVDMTPKWRSKVLHPFLCRLFYDIPEHNVAKEIELVRKYTHSRNPDRSAQDKKEDFRVFYAQDLLEADLKDGS